MHSLLKLIHLFTHSHTEAVWLLFSCVKCSCICIAYPFTFVTSLPPMYHKMHIVILCCNHRSRMQKVTKDARDFYLSCDNRNFTELLIHRRHNITVAISCVMTKHSHTQIAMTQITVPILHEKVQQTYYFERKRWRKKVFQLFDCS